VHEVPRGVDHHVAVVPVLDVHVASDRDQIGH
jgi:hypothetical protein